MRLRQVVVMWLGIIVVVVMGLFPPWRVNAVDFSVSEGYGFIWHPPEYRSPDGYRSGMQIDLTRLVVQWVMVASVTGGMILTLCGKPKS